MKSSFFLGLFLLMGLRSLTQTARNNQADIEHLLTAFTDAWNQHDAKAYASLFAEDADLTTVAGKQKKDSAKIKAAHQNSFETIWKKSQSNYSDSLQIVAIIDAWQAAWNIHDMHAFANLFHNDGIWILWNGKVWQGRDSIETGHAAVHKTVFRNSVQTKKIDEISFVGPNSAVVRLYSTLTGDERYPEKVVESRNLLVVTKRDTVWKIGWGQNTRFPEFTTK